MLYLSDCREVTASLPADRSFMGKGWDHGVPDIEFGEAALRVAKPGAHLLALGGQETVLASSCA